PTTYHDLPPELIERIGDYVPVQDVKNFSVVNRRTYHAMQTRQLVYRYWQRANQAVSLASINQLLNEMDGTLADPAQHVEPIDALRQRLQALPEAEQGEAFKRLFAAAQRIPKHGLPIQKALM
ncbi:F-box protein, partial [Mycetohabitans sp. B4]|uniref:F-box protein n=2 Tax=Burkholderiales TaxID=80840 RepID=UPI001F23C436